MSREMRTNFLSHWSRRRFFFQKKDDFTEKNVCAFQNGHIDIPDDSDDVLQEISRKSLTFKTTPRREREKGEGRA